MKTFVFFFTFCLLSGLFASNAQATTMSNDNYILQMNQAENRESENPIPTPKAVTEEKPYKITTLGNTFGFSISQAIIDFGILSPTNPVTRTTSLVINHDSLLGYSVFAYENHSLAKDDASIPDTTCDDGICKENTASLWTNILTYGFGYRCDNLSGEDCVTDFLSPDYFKQFADASQNEVPQTIVSGWGKDTNPQAEITYKINVSNTFKNVSYGNTVTYIAIPSY